MKNDFLPDLTEVTRWAKSLIDRVREALGINSGKSLMREEVGKVLSSELARGLAQNSKEAVAAFKLVKSELDYQRQLDLIDEATYYGNLEILRDKYFSTGSENWVKYTAEIYKYQKQLLENETKNLTEIYDTVADYAEDKFNELIKKQNKFTDKLSGYGGISMKNTVHINGKSDVFYSTRDLQSDILDIKSFAARLSELSQLLKGSGMAPDAVKGFLDEINSLGVSGGLSYMNYLLAGDRENAVSYARLWAEKRAISESIGSEFYKEDFEAAAEDVAGTLKTALENAGYEIPEGFFESGKISAENFGRAFLAELDDQLGSIHRRIAEFAGGIALSGGGDVYNTTNQYNISASNGTDTIEQIRRYDTVKRLSGV